MAPKPITCNTLYYGDDLSILRGHREGQWCSDGPDQLAAYRMCRGRRRKRFKRSQQWAKTT
jgi:hypothetical protein